jgi:hypothetical protein
VRGCLVCVLRRPCCSVSWQSANCTCPVQSFKLRGQCEKCLEGMECSEPGRTLTNVPLVAGKLRRPQTQAINNGISSSSSSSIITTSSSSSLLGSSSSSSSFFSR